MQMREFNFHQGGEGFGKSIVDRQVAEQIQPADRRSLQVDNKPVSTKEFFQFGDCLANFPERQRCCVAAAGSPEQEDLRGKGNRQVSVGIPHDRIARESDDLSAVSGLTPWQGVPLHWPP